MLEEWRNNPKNFVKKLAQTVEAELKPEFRRWERWRKKYSNKWYLDRAYEDPKYKLRYSTNYIFQVVKTLMGYVRDTPPAKQVVATEKGDRLTAELLDLSMDKVLQEMDWDSEVFRAVKHAFKIGTAWLKQRYDPVSNRIYSEALAPEEVLVDPWCKRWESARFLIHRSLDVDREWIEAVYGVDVGSGGDGENGARKSNAVEVQECWFRVPVIDEETGVISSRWEYCTVAGNVLLTEPAPSPYRRVPLPFVPVWDDPPDDGVLGIGVIEMIEPLQDLADALDMQIYKLIKKTANRIRYVGQGAGVTANDIADEPGNYDVLDPSRIKWEDAPSYPGELFAFRQEIERRIQVITGMYEAALGMVPGRVTAASAVALLQDASFRRIEESVAVRNASLEKVLMQILELMLQYYSVPEFQRIVGDGVKVIGDYPPDLVTPEDRQRFKEAENVGLVLAEVEPYYDVRVTTNTAIPHNKSQRSRLAVELAQLGILDDEAVLTEFGWPNASEIIRRKREKEVSQLGPRLPNDKFSNMPGGFNPLEVLMKQGPGEGF